MKRKLWRILALSIMVIGLAFTVTNAQSQNPSYFDSITNFQQNVAELWKTRAFILSTTLFALLATIQAIFYGYRYLSKGFRTNTSKIWRKFATLLILYFILLGFYQL